MIRVVDLGPVVAWNAGDLERAFNAAAVRLDEELTPVPRQCAKLVSVLPGTSSTDWKAVFDIAEVQ